VRRLILNHISGRLADEEIQAEPVSFFPDTAIAADLACVAVWQFVQCD
jgi:ribonuclease BN (tRNA processing enzyme)